MKESAVFTAGAQQGVWVANVQKPPKLPVAFREKFLKTGRGRGLQCVASTSGQFSDWVDGEVIGINIINLLVPNGLGSTCLWSAYS